MVRKGTPREIATQGFSSTEGLGVATQGFIEPIIGDIILGGHAIVEFSGTDIITGGMAGTLISYCIEAQGGLATDGDGFIIYRPRYIGSGGLITGGAALVETTIVPVVGGDIETGGMAQVSATFNVFPDGGLITDGAGNITVSYCIEGGGGLITDGEGNVTTSYCIEGDGGLITGGEADIDSNIGPIEFGRGGAFSGRRVPRLPNTEFEFPIFQPDDYLEPMDYLKKIQDALEKAEKDKSELFHYLANVTISIGGRGQVIAILRDQPDSEMVVANNPPLEPIELDLPSVFSQGQSAKEIAYLEDQLLIHDILGRGKYTVKKGKKHRFVHDNKRTTGGAASVQFVSGASVVKHVNIKRRRQQQEDEDLLLGINKRRMMSRQERDDEELRLLGFFDD